MADAAALPEGFRQLEYIESGSGQYIDLSTVTLARVVMDVMPLGYGSLCGAYAYRSVSASHKAYITNDIRHTASGFILDAWQAASNAFAGAKLNQRITVDVNFYSGAAEVDGVSKTVTIDTTARNMNNYSLTGFLLARRTGNSSNSTVTVTNAIPARLYGCKFYSRTGGLLRDYVPARNAAGVTGLYDLLHGGFLTSPSGTAFTAGAEIAPPKVAVTLTASPSGGGTASGSGEYEPGESVTVRATPATGFRFLRWEENGAEVSAAAAYTFTVTAARSLAAVFERIPTYTVTLTASPAEGGTVTGAGTYAQDESATVRASEASGWRFLRWEEGGVQASTVAAYTFRVTKARALTACFERSSYTVTAAAAPPEGGTVAGAGGYAAGGTAVLEAFPVAGWRFVRWEERGAVIGTGQALSFVTSADRTVTAVFERIYHKVTTAVRPLSGGTAAGAGEYAEGSTVTLTAAAKPGRHFVRWEENGRAVSADAAYTFTVSAARSLTAVFADDEKPPVPRFRITVSACPPEGGSVTGGGSYEQGAQATVRAAAAFGWEFAGWEENGVPAGSSAALSFQVTAARALTARFTALPLPDYTVTLDAQPPEGGTVSGGGAYPGGARAEVRAAANAGFRFVCWQAGGEAVSSRAAYAFRGTGDTALTALFEPVPEPAPLTVKGRRLIEYLPHIVRELLEFRVLTGAEDPEFWLAWDAAARVMANQFLETADTLGVSIWERELGLHPKGTDTLAVRKARIRAMWAIELPYTLTWLRRWAGSICGAAGHEETVTDYTVNLAFDYTVLPDAERLAREVMDMLREVRPCNMRLLAHALLQSEGLLSFGAASESASAIEIFPEEG